MTREEIQTEITRLKEEVRQTNDDINDFIREMPECRKADRQSLKMCRMNIPGRGEFLNAESKTEARISEYRQKRDGLKAKLEELKAQLRDQPRPTNPDSPRMVGVVKWYNASKEFGFIKVDNRPDVWVHKSALMESSALETGDKVTFKCVQGQKGFKAVDVRYFTE